MTVESPDGQADQARFLEREIVPLVGGRSAAPAEPDESTDTASEHGSTPSAARCADDVRAIEIERHLRTSEDELVGLALSGGGIRSATFGLGVLQAIHAHGVFKKIDYVSTVSGGGYLGGWLQAVMARGRLGQALATGGQEPREVRFLRAYSNYLTPKLGLFSGDTWAAVGTTLRNLILNFSILSLSLLALLFLPWVAALGFWLVVPASPGAASAVVAAGLLLTVAVTVSALNMARPLEGGVWAHATNFKATSAQVLLLVVLPSLVAMWLLSAYLWAHVLHSPVSLPGFVAAGAIGYGAVWFVGLVLSLAINVARASRAATPQPPTAIWTLLRAGSVLLVSAAVAGGIATFVLLRAAMALVEWVGPDWSTALWVFPLAVMSLLICTTVHIGLAGAHLSDETREWWGRTGGIEMLVTLLFTGLTLIALAGPHLLDWMQAQVTWAQTHPTLVKSIAGAVWGAITGAGILAGRSARTANGQGSATLEAVGRVAPAVFVAGYLLILSNVLYATLPTPVIDRGAARAWPGLDVGLARAEAVLEGRTLRVANADWRDGAVSGSHADLGGVSDERTLALMATVLLNAFLTAALAWFISWRVDLNEFSLHALYRNRLVRCYLGASRGTKRSAHPFTGFDPRDDVPLAAATRTRDDDRSRLVAPIRPYPIFNAALNLVGGRNLAWQQRKAASFVFTPEFCGFEYRRDEDNETGAGKNRRSAYAPTREHGGDALSLGLGLAMSTSGAAASPNMGYHSSPTLAFLMTVFNVRLGWWLRNPSLPETWKSQSTGLSLRELMYELLGMTTDDKDWVYLSDGGHFENLGIYELVRRRCRFIVVSDAGQDGLVTFEDLGNAIEKCRADFGVDIEIDLSKVRPAEGRRFSEWHGAVGTIRYDLATPGATAGTLLYLKSSLTGDEPADVLRYASLHAEFPHESTADQFFDESQFESYRALGYHVGCEMFGAVAEHDELAAMPPVELFTHLRQQWTRSAPVPHDGPARFSRALAKVWATVGDTPELRFIDGQIFPEWPTLARSGLPEPPARRPSRRGGTAADAAGTTTYWLPESVDERRAGFYLCVQMLQLMEDVYLEYRLEEHFDHIDNRGWMNLFQHWAWSGMLAATWAITGATFDPRFQRFCRRRLSLSPGVPYVDVDKAIRLPSPAAWRGSCPSGSEARAAHERAWQAIGLNFLEVDLVGRFLDAHECAEDEETRGPLQLIPFRVCVESPRKSDGNPLAFNVGYLLAHIDWDRDRFDLRHIRIQNHLRKMGLARAALGMIAMPASSGGAPRSRATGWGMYLNVVAPASVAADGAAASAVEAEAMPSAASLRRVHAIVKSFPHARSSMSEAPVDRRVKDPEMVR